jgi:hypothetical protein
MEFSLKKVMGFIIGIVIALVLATITNSQFNGFENTFAKLVGG